MRSVAKIEIGFAAENDLVIKENLESKLPLFASPIRNLKACFLLSPYRS